MYTAAYNRSQLTEESEGSCKVDTVCDVLRTALIEEDENKWDTPKIAIEKNSHIGGLGEIPWWFLEKSHNIKPIEKFPSWTIVK